MKLLRLRTLLIAITGCLLVSACGVGDPDASDDGTGGSGGAATGGTGTGGRQGTEGTGGAGSGGAGTGNGTGGSLGSGGGAGGSQSGGTPGTGGTGGPGVSGSGGATTGQGGGGRTASGGASAGTGGRAGAPGSGGNGGSAATTGGNGGGRAGAGGRASTGGASGAGGAGGTGPNAPGGKVSGYGTVLFWARSPAQIVRLQTSMIVPAQPPASGTLFLWPGLQPDGANFNPINNGVLQPVLTWGPACTPGTKPRSYSTWWISGQYVNTNGNEPGYTGCNGGPIMPVDVGDVLNIDIALAGSVWTQTVVDAETGQSVSYSIDLKNQAQNLAYFVIEEYSQTPVSDVIFTNITLTFAAPDAADCKVAMRGQTDYVSVPVPSSDGRTCAIQQINLRAQD